MDNQHNFFSMNKTEDWEKGFFHQLSIDENGWIGTEFRTGDSNGFFISRSCDTYVDRMIWHRLLMDFDAPENSSIKISCCASDQDDDRFEDGRVRKVDEYLFDSTISPEAKLEYFRERCKTTFTNAKDVLIRSLKGRYLWIKIEFAAFSEKQPVLKKVRIYFDTRLFLEYLPDIYKQEKNGGAFLGRFLSIFQSLFLDMENQIDNIARHYDAGFAKGDFLEWLSGWVMVEDAYMWDEKRLRYLTQNAVEIYKLRGTRKGMMEAVKLYTGEYPFIVESFETAVEHDDEARTTLMADLYGSNAFMFTVIVRNTCVETPKAYAELLRIIDNNRPANTQVNLVVIAPLIYLDRHTYMGINTNLSEARPVHLDGKSQLFHNKV